MAFDSHKNLAYSTVATAPSPASSGTSLTVASGDGTKFPAASFNATVWPAGSQPTTANAEIVRVTVVSTDTFTITRAQESTSARTIIVGDQIAATITVRTITDIEGKFPVAIVDGGTGQTTASAAFDALSPVTTRGDLIYRSATTNARLAAGSQGQWFRQGANDPAWADESVVSKSSNYTLTAADDVVLGSGSTTLTLPTAVGRSGQQFTIKKTDSANTLTIATTASQTIDGATSIALITQYNVVSVVSDGSNWQLV